MSFISFSLGRMNRRRFLCTSSVFVWIFQANNSFGVFMFSLSVRLLSSCRTNFTWAAINKSSGKSHLSFVVIFSSCSLSLPFSYHLRATRINRRLGKFDFVFLFFIFSLGLSSFTISIQCYFHGFSLHLCFSTPKIDWFLVNFVLSYLVRDLEITHKRIHRFH